MSIDELIAMPDPTEGDVHELALRLRDALDAKARLEEVIGNLQLELPARMEGESVMVPGVGVLRKQTYKASSWRDDRSSADFRKAVGETAINKVATDIVTGEVDPVRRNVGRAVVEQLWEYVPSFSTIKAAGAKDGIDLDDYRDTSEFTKVVLDMVGI